MIDLISQRFNAFNALNLFTAGKVDEILIKKVIAKFLPVIPFTFSEQYYPAHRGEV